LDVTVVRTPLGVAETGSILVTEKELGVNTIAVLAQHLVVLLDPADLVENIHAASATPASRTPPTRSCCRGRPDQPTSAA
jgi:L-lactate dehydrogenase complex protein LldG